MAVELAIEKTVKFGSEFAIVYAAWGKRVTNNDLLDRFGREKDYQSFLEATGIVERYHHPVVEGFPGNRSDIAREIVDVGIRLTRSVLAANGWNNADHLILTTSVPPDEEGQWGLEIARQLGIPLNDVRYSLLACDGAIAALLDVSKEKELANKRVVMTAIEPLSYMVNPDNGKDLAIFGIGAAAFAFRPKNIKVFNGKTVIMEDRNGVIRVPQMYGLPVNQTSNNHPWYEFREGGRSVFSSTKEGSFLMLPRSDQPYLQMDGIRTAVYFARAVPPVVFSVLSEYYEQNGQDCPIRLCIAHQPSEGVKGLFEKELAKRLESAKLPPIEMPWILKDAKIGNVSSATPLISMAEQLGRISLDNVYNITAYGIGSGITSMNVQFKP